MIDCQRLVSRPAHRVRGQRTYCSNTFVFCCYTNTSRSHTLSLSRLSLYDLSLYDSSFHCLLVRWFVNVPLPGAVLNNNAKQQRIHQTHICIALYCTYVRTSSGRNTPHWCLWIIIIKTYGIVWCVCGCVCGLHFRYLPTADPIELFAGVQF